MDMDTYINIYVSDEMFMFYCFMVLRFCHLISCLTNCYEMKLCISAMPIVAIVKLSFFSRLVGWLVGRIFIANSEFGLKLQQ